MVMLAIVSKHTHLFLAFLIVNAGNVHALILYNNEEEAKIGKELQVKMIKHALELDGTCELTHKTLNKTIHFIVGTGEHGVGLGKKSYLVDELGYSTVQFMKHLKKSIDPLNLFNPEKVCLIY
jgi:D-lactate dehydrogenase (cytochrome)